jgi:hypothetical protein
VSLYYVIVHAAGDMKVMDGVSTGLDAATTFDIIRSIKTFVTYTHSSAVISLLQPAPEVFALFDDLVLLSQGQLIYHGPVEEVLEYFEKLGYECPGHVDVADFLQEIPMPEGRMYLRKPTDTSRDAGSVSSSVVVSGSGEGGTEEQLVLGGSGGVSKQGSGGRPAPPVGTSELAAAWTSSALCRDMQADMTSTLAETPPPWLPHHNEKYAASFSYYVHLLLQREVTLLKRDLTFIETRVVQAVVEGAIVATLFTNLKPSDVETMGGFLFFAGLQCKFFL